jgi:hypothetical protein
MRWVPTTHPLATDSVACGNSAVTTSARPLEPIAATGLGYPLWEYQVAGSNPVAPINFIESFDCKALTGLRSGVLIQPDWAWDSSM